MHTSPPTRESLLRYLLNEVDETERERIDTLLIADSEYAAQFQEIEYDLVDALAAGELTGSEKARTILALAPADRFSPERHRLRSSIAPPEPMPSADVPRIGIARRNNLVRPRFRASWLALAALALVAVALGISRLAFRPAASAPNEPQASSATHAGPVPGATKESSPPKAVAAQPKSLAKPAPAPVMAMLLLPGASRSSNALDLRIPREASIVQIDWPAPADTGKTAHYRLQMMDDTGKAACTSAGTVRHGAEGTLIRFRCNAPNVPAGTVFVRVADPAEPEGAPLLEVTVAVAKP